MAHLTAADVPRVLTQSRVVAVLGAHPERFRPAHYVPAYLVEQGYTVLPVNPRFVGTELFGHPVAGTLGELGPVDVVDVFRRSDALPGHLEEVLAMAPLPRVVWLQTGIVHAAFAEALVAHGIDVIQDRCMLADHQRLR